MSNKSTKKCEQQRSVVHLSGKCSACQTIPGVGCDRPLNATECPSMTNRSGATGRCCGSGFSLMEVLVAISVMGIVYTTLFGLMTTSLKNIRRIEEREKVVRYSQMKLNELVLRSLQAHEEDLPLSGRFDESYSWKAEVLALENEEERDNSRPIGLSRIRLTALREDPAGEPVYSLETIAWTAKPPKPQ